MRSLGRSTLESFLRAVDRSLTAPCQITLIGGAVVGLKFKGHHFTSDLDLWPGSDAAFWDAVERVNQSHEPYVPVESVSIASAPQDFEDRLVPLDLLGLTKLRVLIPEAHDLVIMKMARGVSHDLDAIEDIHKAQPLNLETLLTRHANTYFTGPEDERRLVLLSTVARIFGDEAARDVEQAMLVRNVRQ